MDLTRKIAWIMKTRRNIKGSESWRHSDSKRRMLKKRIKENIRMKEAIYKLKGHVERRKIVLVSNFKSELNGTSKIKKSPE